MSLKVLVQALVHSSVPSFLCVPKAGKGTQPTSKCPLPFQRHRHCCPVIRWLEQAQSLPVHMIKSNHNGRKAEELPSYPTLCFCSLNLLVLFCSIYSCWSAALPLCHLDQLQSWPQMLLSTGTFLNLAIPKESSRCPAKIAEEFGEQPSGLHSYFQFFSVIHRSKFATTALPLW